MFTALLLLMPLATAEASTSRAVEPACDATELLEDSALRGLLGVDSVTCLEDAVRLSPSQELRRSASALLIDNAYALGDRVGWAALTRRHLETVEPDADLAYRYAIYQARLGPSATPEVRRWLELAVTEMVEKEAQRDEVVERLLSTMIVDQAGADDSEEDGA
jgi:hypothetical protein